MNGDTYCFKAKVFRKENWYSSYSYFPDVLVVSINVFSNKNNTQIAASYWDFEEIYSNLGIVVIFKKGLDVIRKIEINNGAGRKVLMNISYRRINVHQIKEVLSFGKHDLVLGICSIKVSSDFC